MDIDAALRDGYSLEEINSEAARRVKFDYAGAKAGGYTDEEILGELRNRLKQPAKKEKADILTSVKSSFANLGNMADLVGTTVAGGGAALFGDEKEAVRLYDEMEQRRASRNQWANPEQLELSGVGKLAGTLATLPMQVVGMGLSPAETARTALESGESNTTARKAALTDAALNAVGIALPGFKQGSMAVRAGTGFAANAAQDYASKLAIQQMLETEKGKAAFEPTLEDAAVSGIIGGGFGAALGTKASKAPTGKRIDAIRADAQPQPKAPVERPKPRSPEWFRAQEQLGADMLRREAEQVDTQHPLLEPFDERSPVSKYQTEMAPDMWRTDENGIPIRADLSMEIENLQQPLQRNLFGDELDVNFPRDPNEPLTGSGNVLRDTDLEVNSRPLTEAIDAIPEGIRNRENGKFAPGTTRQSALDRLRGELPADASLEVARIDAEHANWIRENALEAGGDKPKGFNAKMKKQKGALLFGKDPLKIEQTEDGFVAKVGDKEVGYLRSNITPEQRAMLGEDASVDMVKVQDDFKGKGVGSALYEAWAKANEGNVIPSGKTSPDAWKAWKRNLPGGVDKFVNQEAQRILGGADPQMVLGNIPDPEVAQRVQARAALLKKQSGAINVSALKQGISDLDKKIERIEESALYKNLNFMKQMDMVLPLVEEKTKLMDQLTSVYEKETRVSRENQLQGFKDLTSSLGELSVEQRRASMKVVPFDFKKQGGGLKMDWSDPNKEVIAKKIPGIRESLKALIPTTLSADETIALAKQGKDVNQNLLQRGINLFTKGGLYQAEKTGNPIIKFTVDKVLNADRLARADIRDYLHDSLAPAMRDLPKAEFVEIAKILNLADLEGWNLTPEIMRKHGLSAKQVDFAMKHRETMDYAFNSINKAREAAGKPPIEKRLSYAAMAATGSFRKLVYKMGENGEKEVVGVIGAKTKWGLDRIEKKLAGKDYVFGETKAQGTQSRRGGDINAVMEALEFLGENNPNAKDFLDIISDLKQQEAYSFVNAKKHTKGKKGVFGMEGRKQWLTDELNAKEFMDSQLLYAETAIRWGHLSEASVDIKKVLSGDVNQPNAKKWSEQYFQNALGINPTETGRALEQVVDSFWNATGVGTTIPRNIQGYSRKIVNTVLLGLNPAFLATNVIQPLLSLPAMNAFLATRGMDENSMLTFGYDNMAEATFTLMKKRTGKLNALEQAATEYAQKNHVYGTELVDTSNVSRKNAEFYLDKVGNFLSSNVESTTRQMMYYTFVHMLDKNGMGRDFGLAHNLTDMAMNNYSPVERPQVFNALGPIGDLAANLSSFKHNELSRLAMFARDVGNKKEMRPLLMQLGMGVAAAGITGALGFAEADWLYRQISKALGKPDSLSRVVMSFSEKMGEYTKHPYALSHGGFSYLGLDMSKRLGISDVIPNSIGEAMFPGGGKLVDIASTGLSTIGDPSEINMKRFAREAAPGILQGPMDREWFSDVARDEQGNILYDESGEPFELALNRRTLEGQLYRTKEDKMAKNFGFTGINESVVKQKMYDLQQQGIGYAELRSGVVKKMAEQLFTKGTVDARMWENYIKYEGDPQKLEQELIHKVEKQEMSLQDAMKLQALSAKTIPQLYQGQRIMETLQ